LSDLGERCAGMLLACYLSLAIWALAAPSQYDPQQGMAIGFIIPVALARGLSSSHAGGSVRPRAFLPHARM